LTTNVSRLYSDKSTNHIAPVSVWSIVS